MSKKAERVKRSFAKQWVGVISGSVFVLSTQAAHAGHHGGFNGQNARIDHIRGERHALRVQARNQTMQTLNGDTFRLNNGINLDLTATNANITLGANLFKQADSVTISMGGENKTFGAGSQVTSAEYVAIKQVLGGRGQSITVDGAGRATGGQFDLNSISANSNNVVRAASLVIPENVVADGKFGRGSEFRLVGDLDNYGSIVASSNNRNGSTLHADDINNHSGASIASVKNDLHLIADGSLVNDGSITSAASLSMTSGSGFTNRGNVQATNNVSINAANVTNSGTIAATNGNINIDGPSTAVLTINNTGGVLTAMNGAVNLRSADYTGAFDTNMNGGDVLSNTVNINSGNGLANISVNELDGEINQTGLGAHVQASTDVLNIGSTCLTGDPTYYNTAGSINIAGNINVAEALTLIAFGDITSANNISITASNAAGGFPINFIAGANMPVIVGGSDQPAVGPIPPANPNNGAVGTVNGNVFGGSIILGSNVTISTRGTNTPSNGADVIMDAFAGVGNGSGRILISGTTITTGGRGTGNNGNVTLIAGITGNTDAINVGVIDTTGGTGTGGSISLHAVQPVVSSGASGVGFNPNGSNTGVGTYVAGVNAGQTGNIRITGAMNGASVLLNAGNSIFVDNNVTSKSGLVAFGHGSFTLSGTSQIIATDAVNGLIGINTDGNITGGSTTLMQAPTMLLISNNGKIGVSSGLRLRVDADTLIMTALNGSAFINDIDSLNLSTSNVGGTLEVVALDSLTTTGASTGDIVKLVGESITVNKNVTGGTSLTAISGTDIIGGGGILAANNVFLTASSADMGTNVNPILTNADNLVANAPFGGVVIQEQDSVNFGGGVSSAKFTFSATAVGTLSSTSLISANNVNLQGSAFGLTGQIVGTTGVSLFSQGDFNNGNVTGSVSTQALTLQSNGDIGTSVVPFKVNGASNLQASVVSAISNNQSVFVQGASGVVFGASSAKSTLSLSSLGSLTLAGNLTANTNATGTISVNAASGTLKINDGIQILSTDDINITNSGTSKTLDKLVIGNSVKIATNATNAGDGNINLVLGTTGGKPKTKIKNITVLNQGGTVQFLNKGLTATASTPQTTFTAIKANIVTGNSLNTKNFTLGKSVIVTAD